jgi:tol-pal system protein YbgF
MKSYTFLAFTALSTRILATSILAMGVLASCVTTREQYNSEKGISSASEAPIAQPTRVINSEDLSTEAAAPRADTRSADVVNAVVAGGGDEESDAPVTAPVRASGTPSAQHPDYTSYSADELKAEVARLSGRVEELEHEKKQGDQAQGNEYKKAQERIQELEKKITELTPQELKAPEGKTNLEAGKDALANNRYDDAIQFFTLVISKKDTGKEAEEASFLRGESYFKKSLYSKAIVDYSRFSERYQKSTFHPKALLKIGESFEALGRKEDAKAFYSDLFEKFPKTAEGKLAKKRLKK